MGKIRDFLTGRNHEPPTTPGARVPMTGNGYRPVTVKKATLDKVGRRKGKHAK